MIFDIDETFSRMNRKVMSGIMARRINVKKGLLMIFIVFLILTACSDKQESEEEGSDLFVGTWSGTIEIPNQPLNIDVTFANEDELSGMISIPVQGIDQYPLSTVKQKDKDITFTMKIQDQYITFDGALDGDQIAGTFKQNGQSFPFKLTKGEATAKDETAESDGEFLQVETDEGTLYGELETPKGEGPFPIMIMIPGSGPTDRNGNTIAGENNSLKYVAEALAKEGIASLRYDKRGAGKNKEAVGSEEDTSYDLFVDDAAAWIERLEADEQFTEIGIIGHSQGSLTAMLAAQKGNVDILISLSGAGRTIDKVMYDQLSEQLPKDLLEESQEIMKKVKAGEVVDDVSQDLQSVFHPSVQPFLASWMAYDPAEEIQQLDIPTLIVNGENDIQVPVSEAELLQGARPDADMLLIEKMNHVLKEAPEDREGNMATYLDPELPLADGLMDGMIRFLKENKFVE